jgi:hypothetical protein
LGILIPFERASDPKPDQKLHEMKKPDPDKEKNVRPTTLQIASRVSAKNSSPVFQKKAM